MSNGYVPQRIAVALSVMTGDGHFLVKKSESGEFVLPSHPYDGATPTRHIAIDMLAKHTSIDLRLGTWAVLRQVGFFETPLQNHATVLFGVEIPERVPLSDPETRWIDFDTLESNGVRSTTFALYVYACGALRA